MDIGIRCAIVCGCAFNEIVLSISLGFSNYFPSAPTLNTAISFFSNQKATVAHAPYTGRNNDIQFGTLFNENRIHIAVTHRTLVFVFVLLIVEPHFVNLFTNVKVLILMTDN